MLSVNVVEETVTIKLGIRVIEVKENVSGSNDGDFRRFLAENSEEGACPRVVLDLSAMRFINSSGLGAIANMSMRLRKMHGQLVIISPNRELTQVFTVTKLDQVLNIVKDRETAIEFFKSGH